MAATEQQTRRNGLTATGRAPFSERGDDLYETPPEAVHALLAVEKLPQYLWEPAAGRGSIVRVLRTAGHIVIGSDLIDYHEPTHFAGYDFMAAQRAPAGCEAIITNPPYKIASKFVQHATALSPLVYMMLRLAFLEGTGRTQLLEQSHLARVHVFRNRLPRMHRDGWTGKQSSSSIAFAWFVWDRAHQGLPTLNRVSWKSCG